MNPSWSDGGIQLQGKTLPEENYAQVRSSYHRFIDKRVLVFLTLFTSYRYFL